MQRLQEYITKNGWQLASIAAAFLTVGVLLNVSVNDLQANLFTDRKSAPFDGTVMPIKRTPSWIDLSTAEWKLSYDLIPLDKFIDIPDYDAGRLAQPTSSLNYKIAADRMTRNMQVTYSTPYMGDYKLDGLENMGSHLAVDIKIPMGTPIFAIANGVVVKAKNEPSGFGNNVVLRHDEVPSSENPSIKTTYFSGYAHMNSISVTEGDLVVKGQQLGFSGQSGTATTPHLHFQIDNNQAPWHPYWPFTSKEASDAGLNFWDGVNAGLGKDKALATTINPLVYVQKYRNAATSGVTSPLPVSPVSTPVTPSVVTPFVSPDELPPSTTAVVTPTSPVSIISQPTVDAKPVYNLSSFQLKYDDSFSVGTTSVFKLVALDESGKVITNFKPSEEISLKVVNGSATLDKSYLTASDFSGGEAVFKLTPTADFGIRVSATSGAITKLSDLIQMSVFKDLAEGDRNYVAVNFLKNNDVIRGYPDGTFKSANQVTRVEALKFIYEGLNKEVKLNAVLEFKDTDSKAWYARYIASAQRDRVVKGYEGNLFKPDATVTRAEFIKMLVEAAGLDGKGYPVSVQPYADVEKNAWYAGYIALAKDKNLLDTSSNLLRPNELMTRGEVAQMLYRIIVMKATGNFTYDRTLVVNNDLVSDYYSKFQ